MVPEKSNAPGGPLILMRVSQREVALPLALVYRVLEVRLSDLAPAPRAPSCVMGITNHWGRIVTVVALDRLLDQTAQTSDDGLHPVVILEHGQHQLGLLVDGIAEIFTKQQGHHLETRVDGLITDVVELNKRAVGLLSIDRLLQSLQMYFEAAAKVA